MPPAARVAVCPVASHDWVSVAVPHVAAAHVQPASEPQGVTARVLHAAAPAAVPLQLPAVKVHPFGHAARVTSLVPPGTKLGHRGSVGVPWQIAAEAVVSAAHVQPLGHVASVLNFALSQNIALV